MKHRTALPLLAFSLLPLPALRAQEANSGIDLRATVSTEGLYSREWTGGVRSVLYPVWKMGEHWNFSGAVQLISRPYFYQDLTTQGYGLKGQILQASLGYAKVWKNASLAVRAGQMPSAFGAFLLHYDDADNPLIQMPMGYGYYYAPVTTSGLMGAQADATWEKWDARVQLVNSSPSNARSIFAKDQYGNWAGGVGYTIRQGLRVGLSSYRGPYLDRQEPFFRPGEAEPKNLPATAVGVDAEWAHGHWNFNGEWQHFDMSYRLLPTFRESAAYFEAKRVLHPRWYLAARTGYLHTSAQSGGETYEAAIGFRPNARQLIKIDYMLERESKSGQIHRIMGVQLVTMLHPLSLAWH